MIRRLKDDILSELPQKFRQVIRLPKPAPNRWPNKKRKINNGSCNRDEFEDMSSSDDSESSDTEGTINLNLDVTATN